MEAMIDQKLATQLARHVAAIEAHVPLRPVRTSADYAAAVAALNALLDAGAAQENHPLANLAATLGELVADYDAEHYPSEPVPARELLKHLMEAAGLRQADLPELGTQGVVSELLRGQRNLNLRQVRALASRFKVPASLFIDAS